MALFDQRKRLGRYNRGFSSPGGGSITGNIPSGGGSVFGSRTGYSPTPSPQIPSTIGQPGIMSPGQTEGPVNINPSPNMMSRMMPPVMPPVMPPMMSSPTLPGGTSSGTAYTPPNIPGSSQFQSNTGMMGMGTPNTELTPGIMGGDTVSPLWEAFNRVRPGGGRDVRQY